MHLTDPRVIHQQLSSIRWRGARGKHFGQHFLTDQSVLERIVAALDLSPEETVLEIGPGLGVLTVELAKRAKLVIAVEKDAVMIPLLKKNVAEFSNVEIVHTDALNFKPTTYNLSRHSGTPPWRWQPTTFTLAGNLPYSITIPVIQRFIMDPVRAPSRAVFLVQKEVAERLTSPPGGSARGAITVVLEAAAATSEIVCVVPASAFYPAPAVDGAVIRIVAHHDSQSVIPALPAGRRNPQFSNFVFNAFRYRRKQIGGILPKIVNKPHGMTTEKLKDIGVDPKSRPQELTLEQWRSLFAHFVL